MSKWKFRTESKNISESVLSQKSTEDLVESKDFLDKILSLRKLSKLEKTYINGTRAALDYNGVDKVFVDYRFDGTATGRLSCAMYAADQPMGVSFHTLPRGTESNIRSMFVAPDDHAFITVDYSTMELRVLANLARETKMIEAFKSGDDLHSYTGSLLFGKDVSSVTKTERQLAKMVSFLIVYGGGPFNLAETTGVSLRKAERVVSSYKQVYPKIFRFMDYVHGFVQKNGHAYTIFGRRRNLEDITSRDSTVKHRALRQGFNFVIQSTSSDILLFSLLGINRDFEKAGLESRIVSTVHDSIEIISPLDELDKSSMIIYNNMINYPVIREKFGMEFEVPFQIETVVGKSFGDGLEATHGSDGNIKNIEDIRNYVNSAN